MKKTPTPSDKNNFPQVPDVDPVRSVTEHFGVSRTLTYVFAGLAILGLLASFVMSVFFAPSLNLTITTGPKGSTAENQALKYQAYLKTNHKVTLTIVNSQGSLDNLGRLCDAKEKVEVGFVQSEVFETNPSTTVSPEIRKKNEHEAEVRQEENKIHNQTLDSLGSVSYQPLFVFYRNATPITLLSDFSGKRISIGAEGSGTHKVALTLLKANGIAPGGATVFDEQDSNTASEALLEGSTDAVFLMGDSASTTTLRKLLTAPGIQLFSMAQADAVVRKFTGLNKIILPQGGIDFAKNIPARDVVLVGPTVELIARKNLNPALIDLLLETAKDIQGKASLIQNKGEFPKEIEQSLKLSPDAERYYKSGPSWMIRRLPFWMATMLTSLFDQLVVIVPTMMVVFGSLQGTVKVYKMQVQFRLNRRYKALVRIEKEYFRGAGTEVREALLKQLDSVERETKAMKIPGSFAGQFYGLREHIRMVRELLLSPAQVEASAEH